MKFSGHFTRMNENKLKNKMANYITKIKCYYRMGRVNKRKYDDADQSNRDQE